MAEPAEKASVDEPLIDPGAVDRAYRRQRAKRRALQQRSRERRRANVRFWVIVLGLLALGVYLSVTIWQQVQNLFGL
jgi:cytochrome c-type biogenesis protein CcmH/NrfG